MKCKDCLSSKCKYAAEFGEGDCAMIKEDYISFETAKLLKEKGFNESVNRFYEISTGKPLLVRSEYCRNSFTIDYAAPTHQMALKWLREVHNIDIIAPPQFDNVEWTYSPIIFKLSIPCTEIRLNDNKQKKELAIEVALKFTLENLI